MAAWCDQDSLISQLSLVRPYVLLLIVDAHHRLSKRELDARLLKTLLKLLYEQQASICSEMCLLYFEKRTAKTLGPCLVGRYVGLWKYIRPEELRDHFQIVVGALLVPVLGRKADRVGEVHLAVVSHAASRIWSLVDHEYSCIRCLFEQRKGGAHSCRTCSDNNHIVCCH